MEKGTHHALDARLTEGNRVGFKANGYTHFKVVETDSTLRLGQITYFNKDSLIFLPIAHKYAQTSFVFTGDTVLAETLVVGDYNARIIFTDKCQYALDIDEPKVKKCTFDSFHVKEFDPSSQNLKIQLWK
ncbi:MAG: hypothetical protein ABUT20_51295 [Bacteroidota bacterium]